MRHKQSKKEGLLASQVLYLENHVKRVVVCCMIMFCAMLWNKNLVLPLSRM